MNYEILIEYITHFRKHAQLTQLYLSHRLGSGDEDYYGKIERCQKVLKLHCLKKIAYELGLSPIILLYISGYKCFTPPHVHFTSDDGTVEWTTFSAEATDMLNKICVVHNDLFAAHFYQRVYKGIRALRNHSQINSKQLSCRMNYSVNHFARMERDNCEITLPLAFDICNALNISFAKLMLFSNCVDFFTDSKGVFISLSDLKERYPDFRLKHCIESMI